MADLTKQVTQGGSLWVFKLVKAAVSKRGW
jgi:hypothetical protein